MRLVTLSRREIEAAVPDIASGPPAIAICIAYPDGRLHKVVAQGSLRAVLHLRFSDCDGDGAWSFPENKDGRLAIPMTRGQGIDVVDFVTKWRDEAQTIYVACYGGVSRSRGVAAGIAAVFGWDDSAIYAEGVPNTHCKAMVMSAPVTGDLGKQGGGR